MHAVENKPTHIGRYEVIRPLAAGGMARIYIGRHQGDGHVAAIKVLLDSLADDESLRQRFCHEARIIASIRHPSVVTLYDVGLTDDGDMYLAMEYIQGVTLKKWLSQHKSPALEDGLAIVVQIADALAAVHATGVVHRDLKPSNIMLMADPNGVGLRAKVLDFGIAKAFAGTDDPGVTKTGFIVGTPRYMAPEQCLGLRTVDHRADVYGLGLILYRLLAGGYPFQARGSAEMIAQHVHSTPTLPSRHNPAIGQSLEALVMRCLAKEPGDRVQTMSELASALGAERALLVAGLGSGSRAVFSSIMATLPVVTALTNERRGAPLPLPLRPPTPSGIIDLRATPSGVATSRSFQPRPPTGRTTPAPGHGRTNVPHPGKVVAPTVQVPSGYHTANTVALSSSPRPQPVEPLRFAISDAPEFDTGRGPDDGSEELPYTHQGRTSAIDESGLVRPRSGMRWILAGCMVAGVLAGAVLWPDLLFPVDLPVGPASGQAAVAADPVDRTRRTSGPVDRTRRTSGPVERPVRPAAAALAAAPAPVAAHTPTMTIPRPESDSAPRDTDGAEPEGEPEAAPDAEPEAAPDAEPEAAADDAPEAAPDRADESSRSRIRRSRKSKSRKRSRSGRNRLFDDDETAEDIETVEEIETVDEGKSGRGGGGSAKRKEDEVDVPVF